MRALEHAEAKPDVARASAGETGNRSAAMRRSSRVTIDIPITVFGQNSDGKMFHEQVKTITVSAHGALVHLGSNIDSRRPVLLVNPKTQMEVQCRAAYRKEVAGRGAEIGLEFVSPLPKFWGIHFPPDDWNPAERKQPVATQPAISISRRGPGR